MYIKQLSLALLISSLTILNIKSVPANLAEIVKTMGNSGQALFDQSKKLKFEQLKKTYEQMKAAGTVVQQVANSKVAKETVNSGIIHKGFAAVKSFFSTTQVSSNGDPEANISKAWIIIKGIGALTDIRPVVEKAANGIDYVRSRIRPTDEEKLQQEKAKIELNKFRAQVALNAALVEHSRAKRNAEGIPLPCLAQAAEYAKWAGQDALKQMIDAFNNCGIRF